MKIMCRVIVAATSAGASAAWAASGAASEESGFLVALFIGLVVMIILGQALPGITLFFRMLRELVSTVDSAATQATGQGRDKKS